MMATSLRYAMINSLYADAIEAANATAAAVARELSRRSWAWASYCMTDDGALLRTTFVDSCFYSF
jgi:hypothetical protein